MIFRKLLSVVLFNWTVLNPIFSYCMYFIHEWRGMPDLRYSLLVFIDTSYIPQQNTSLFPLCPARADCLRAGGGGHVLLLPLVAPQQEGVQAHPQATS